MSIFGDIASRVGSVMNPMLEGQLKGLSEGQLQEVLGHLNGVFDEASGPFDASHMQSLQTMIEELQNTTGHPDDAPPIPHEIDIQAVQTGQVIDAVADNPEATQALMESMQKLLDSSKQMMEQNHDTMLHVIQGLHSDAGDQSGAEVAVVSDHGVADAGHTVASAEPSHGADHHDATDDGSASV